MVLFLTAQKGSNEFLEEDGDPGRILTSRGGTVSLLLWEPPLSSLGVPG